MKTTRIRSKLIRENIRSVKHLYPLINDTQVQFLRAITRELGVSLSRGDLLMVDGKWYITHAGLLHVAKIRRCGGIKTEFVESASNPAEERWVVKATVLASGARNYSGYGDATPYNVSPIVHGAELRIAETRAVNRALRKAHGIAICSTEELPSIEPTQLSRERNKVSVQPVNGNGNGGPKVRDRLCQVIRQYQLDASLVKSYAMDFCGIKTLREASRQQIEIFIAHLKDWAEKDRSALLCQLNSYLGRKEGAA